MMAEKLCPEEVEERAENDGSEREPLDLPANTCRASVVDGSFECRLSTLLLQQAENGDMCDLQLVYAGESVWAHRAVLVLSSQYFKTLFNGRFRRAEDDRTDVTDFFLSIETLQEVRRFIYLRQINLTAENVRSVLHSAMLLLIEDLTVAIERFLMACLTVQNCVTFHTLATDYQLPNLQSQCSSLLHARLSDLILRLPHTLSLSVEFVESALRAASKNLQPASVCRFLRDWYCAQPDDEHCSTIVRICDWLSSLEAFRSLNLKDIGERDKKAMVAKLDSCFKSSNEFRKLSRSSECVIVFYPVSSEVMAESNQPDSVERQPDASGDASTAASETMALRPYVYSRSFGHWLQLPDLAWPQTCSFNSNDHEGYSSSHPSLSGLLRKIYSDCIVCPTIGSTQSSIYFRVGNAYSYKNVEIMHIDLKSYSLHFIAVNEWLIADNKLQFCVVNETLFCIGELRTLRAIGITMFLQKQRKWIKLSDIPLDGIPGYCNRIHCFPTTNGQFLFLFFTGESEIRVYSQLIANVTRGKKIKAVAPRQQPNLSFGDFTPEPRPNYLFQDENRVLCFLKSQNDESRYEARAFCLLSRTWSSTSHSSLQSLYPKNPESLDFRSSSRVSTSCIAPSGVIHMSEFGGCITEANWIDVNAERCVNLPPPPILSLSAEMLNHPRYLLAAGCFRLGLFRSPIRPAQSVLHKDQLHPDIGSFVNVNTSAFNNTKLKFKELVFSNYTFSRSLPSCDDEDDVISSDYELDYSNDDYDDFGDFRYLCAYDFW